MASVVAFLLAVVCCLGVGSPGRVEAEPHAAIGRADRVLVLHSERADLPAVVRIDHGIRSALTGPGAPAIELFAEYLDVARFPDGRRIERYAESLQYRYAESRPDVLIAVGAPAVAFLERRGSAMFPGTPVVVTALEARHLRTRPLPAGFTGIVTSIDTRATLELALGLHHGTRRLAIVAGAAPLDRHWAAETRRAANALAPAVEVVDLGRLAMPAMLDAVAAQPPHTVIFYVHVLSDAAGRRFAPMEALATIARVANAPIYGTYDTYIGQGAVGGRVVRLERLGTRAGEIAARILRGARAEDIAVETGESNADMFDARQLRRWGIAESRLPAGSAVLFREPSVWALYRGYIIAGCAVLALQTAFIAGLLVQRSRRRRAESALAERLRFEVLLSELSTTFLTAPTGALNGEIERALRRMGEELDLDRATMVEADDTTSAMRVTASWERPGTEPVPALVARSSFPWMRAQLLDRQIVRLASPDELPADAVADRASLRGMGTRSVAAVPLILEGAVVGALSFATVRAERKWPDDLVPRLRLLEEAFAHALARRRADSAIRESEERFALVAHEINQPLAAIVTNAQATIRQLGGAEPDAAAVGHVLEDIAADAKRASQVIGRLRALFKKEDAARVPVPVNGLIEQVVRLLDGELRERRIALKTELDASDPVVLGDPVQLQQVALNVFLNAIEAIAAAGSDPREIRVATRRPAPDRVELSIRDTGVGVPEGDLERIFARFFTSKAQGLGMGLPISRSIAETHGGRMWATVDGERGLAMHVELPCETRAPRA